jgi:hypothetical protein
VGIPGRIVAIKGVVLPEDEHAMLDHGKLPDPVGQALADLTERVKQLEAERREERRDNPHPLVRTAGG